MTSTPLLPASNPVISRAFTTSASKIWPLRVAVLIAGLLLFWNLGYAPLWNPDEGRYASASLEMTGRLAGTTQDWVIPHLNTIPRLNKPPLNVWIGAAFIQMLGPSEAAVRLVSALAALGVVLLLWSAGRRHLVERAGLLGALVWATAIFPFTMARVVNTDMLLAFGFTLAMFGLYGLCESAQFKGRDCLMAGVGLGVAALAKGPVGIALPLVISSAFIVLTRGWRRVAWVQLLLALVLCMVIAVPWFVMAEARQPGFLRHFLLAENMARFSGAQKFHKSQPIYFFVPVVLVGLLPWTAFVPLLRERLDRPRLFLWLWAAFIIGGFSLSHVKLATYVLPAFPALALLLGAALNRWNERSVIIRRACCWLLTLICGVTLLIAAKFLLSEKIVPRDDGAHWLVLLAVVVFCGMCAVWQGRAKTHLPVRVGALAVALNLTMIALAGRVALYEDASAPMRAVRLHLDAKDRVVLWHTFQPTAMFYSARPVEIYGVVDNSGLDEAAMHHSTLFHTPQATTLPALLRDKRRVVVIARRREVGQVPARAFLWASNNDYLFFSNQPKPATLHFAYVAPRKLSTVLARSTRPALNLTH